MGIWQRLTIMLSGDVPPEKPADHHIARQAYADFLRAQLIGYAPEKGDDLLAALTVEDGRNTAPFPILMGIETKLVTLLSDKQVERNYWVVRDRLNRVGSTAAIREHKNWAPGGLRSDPADGEPAPLADARAARTAAMAAVGETAMTLADSEAALAAAGVDATDDQRAATMRARAAYEAAVTAASAAASRLADLETAAAAAAVDAGGGDTPPVDMVAIERDAADAEAETRLAQSVDLAATEAAGHEIERVSEGEPALGRRACDTDDPEAEAPIVAEDHKSDDAGDDNGRAQS